ncbi:P-loop containing nucleoside triphosphate hydrolase protein, partial [Geranomyces variabilis]
MFSGVESLAESPSGPRLVTAADLSPATVDLAGILLPAAQVKSTARIPELVQTATTRRNLHSVALAISLNVPILLEGGPGVGKTALVEHAAQCLGRHGTLLKIHLGDQTDAKVLLGTYICTSTPGSFRWQPGVLTTAVVEGRWILFEDIDLAPLEVVSVLIPLLETGWLFVASRGEKVRAKEGFRVFGTRSIGTSRSFHGQAAGEGLWHKVPVAALTDSEVVQVIEHKFPRLKSVGVQSEILSAFKLIQSLYEDKQISGGRTASLRDLIKWCDRAELSTQDRLTGLDTAGEAVDLPLSVREDLLRDAADCFTESMADKAWRDSVLVKIGSHLGVAAHRVQFYCDVHVPNLQPGADTVMIGRAVLPVRQRDPLRETKQRPYAPTPSSLRLMERLSVGISQNEPILLVGETGTGKTTVIQHLAHLTNTPLTVINMSQQSDSSDLLGGFKPVDVKVLAVSVLNDFEKLFANTFSVKANASFLEGVRKAFKSGRWSTFVRGCKMGVKMANDVFGKLKSAAIRTEPQAKKQKTKRVYDAQLEEEWQKFSKVLSSFDNTHQKVSASLLFSFIEGALVKALREGHWVLLDEINLATPETLDCLTGLLASATSSLVLLERGDTEAVVRHPGFRLFGCMNPANDAGKKDLAIGLRSRFTEFWVDAPDATFADLVTIVRQYLQAVLPPSKDGDKLCEDVAKFYTAVRGYAAQGLVYDGADHRVHYSMRTLARALMFATATTVQGIWILRRGIWEGCCMTFGTGLGEKSRVAMEAILMETVAQKINVRRAVRSPDAEGEVKHVAVGGYHLPLGPLATDAVDETYILTETVNQNLAYLARAVMSGKYPVLIQGPTSAGKTSMVEYLAKLTGHTCVRVNNHEGTEVAEYVGGWGEAEEGVDGGRGRLVWQEGILVTALRKGHWLILDELNLAPSDVLESLNRLLDDNRELFIPETQTTVRPHPSFMLFATQNPAGTTYGGRKQLSRAFRNRFLEIHFGDIPTPELHVILERRCRIAPSYAKAIVAVYKALQSTRGRGRVFEGRHGFVTLRDLFRWAGRGAVGYEELAQEGWCLLGERMRSDEDRAIVREVIERELRVSVDVEGMYQAGFERVLAEAATNGAVGGLVDKLVWTPTTKRLFTLVWKCVSHNEPVLLVGETGAGKTTVCQVVASMCGKDLRIVNAHQGSEVGDFIGGMRPVRGRDEIVDQAWQALLAVRSTLGLNSEEADLVAALHEIDKAVEDQMDATDELRQSVEQVKDLVGQSQMLFTWKDGPLTLALREGTHFLLDEISLADDSVLERLNSVLEPSQFLLLSEKGRAESLYASPGFRFLATMNPGGDYGKKELSPALRNRFCEIWVPGVTGRGDLEGLVAKKLNLGGLSIERSESMSKWMMDFYDWFATHLRKTRHEIVSLRDVLAWVEFVVGIGNRNVMDLERAFVHGGCMVIVDGIGVNPTFGVVSGVERLQIEVRECLLDLCGRSSEGEEFANTATVLDTCETFGVEPFFVTKGPEPVKEVQFSFMAPTTLRNLSRVLRALQLIKPVLLEGSPGVGKTSLVTTLAHLTGHALTRINLSEQTDLTDLFGTDLPVEGTGNAGRFAWRDGPFLNAMKRGEWVLLDELNLASQQVLEGLNACLDHRGEVYIPELDRVFKKGDGFRVFAAQNPQGQGGGRKGLPRSFVNRFTSVYVEALSEADVGRIITNIFGAGIEQSTIEKMVRFNERMKEETMEKMRFASRGGPWEFNLRDVVRWVELVKSGGGPLLYLEMMYAQRMRTPTDREQVRSLFAEVFALGQAPIRKPQWWITETAVMIGCAQVARKSNRGGPGMHGSVPIDHLHVLPSMLPTLETLLKCVEMNYMPILTGPAGSGKTSLVRTLAGMCGVTLKEFSMNPGVDSVELLGGFEQADAVRARTVVIDSVGRIVETTVRELVAEAQHDGVRFGAQVLKEWDAVRLTVETGGVAGINEFVDQLQKLVSELAIDVPGRALPPFDRVRALIAAYKETLVHGTHGTFEWVDGTLIKAMEEGHWILLDNVNLCPASVLDRLNPLLESGGVLNVTERGLDASGEIRIVSKRAGFRIFMCLDDRFGEVSRAMRNRGVEVFV